MNTTKTIGEMEQMVKDVGMEIVLKAERLYLKLEDLTNEERAAWMDYLEEDVKTKLEMYEERKKAFQDLEPLAKRYTEEMHEIIKKYRDDPNFDTVQAIRKLQERVSRNISYYDRALDITRMGRVTPYFSLFYVEESVYGSCLIAKRGENVLRYVSIRGSKDPVVTVTGPRAEIIKAQMEAVSKLDASRTLSS